MRKLNVILALLAAFGATNAFAAVGCTLSNPAADLKYLYPDMTSYKEEARELGKLKDGKKAFEGLKERLGSDLDPIYETFDTPYTVYTIYKGNDLIGIVHGVNVPGQGGVIQVFLSTDPQSGEIKQFFFQRIESPAAKALNDKTFRAQFAGLTLPDFYKHDYYKVADPKSDKDKVGQLKPAAVEENGKADYEAAIRGVRKNLILLDLFIYENKGEPYYVRAKESLAKIKGGTEEKK